MNNRICTVVVAATLLSLTSGCSGMKNFLFGRGARCGLCTKVGSCIGKPCFGNTMQAPVACPQVPTYAPAPQYVPAPQPYVAPQVAAPQYTAPQYAAPQCAAPACQVPACQVPTCQTPAPVCGCGTAPVVAGDACGCGGSYYGGSHLGNATSYGPVDPYNNGVVLGDAPVYGAPMGEQIIGEQVIGTNPIVGGEVIQGTPLPSGAVSSDNFQARKFDSDGNKILWEEPLPSGANSL